MFFYGYNRDAGMGRCFAADDFVNCVVRRGDSDMMLKPSLIVLALFVPLVLGGLLAAFLVTDSDMTDDEVGEGLIIVLLMALVAEMALVSFMVFCVSRRNRNHVKRDLVWMESLCDYVDFHGGDSDELRRMYRSASRSTNRFTAFISMVIWIALALFLVAVGAWFYFSDPADGIGTVAMVAVSLVPSLLLLLLQLFLTVGTVVGLPSNHDRLQAEFTAELKKQCSRFGLEIDAMEGTVGRTHTGVHLLLTVVTVGLYGFVCLVITCRRMNKHLRSQWDYETELADRIVKHEGGIGVEATAEGRPNVVVRTVGGLVRFDLSGTVPAPAIGLI